MGTKLAKQCRIRQRKLPFNSYLGNSDEDKINKTNKISRFLKDKANVSTHFTVISMFSGCGGLDLGFLGNFDFLGKHFDKTRFKIIWANELNGSACRTYRKNIGDHIVEGDVWDVIADVPTNADVVIGGFPCQDISINGKGVGVEGKRSGLYRAMVDVVKRVNPKVFIAENVKALLMKHNAISLKRVMDDFLSLGYNVSYQLYNAADYGVPQTRERVFIIGTMPGIDEFIHPEPSCNRYLTAKEAIGDLEKMNANTDFSHIWSLANKSPEQGNRRLIAERPGYTIRAECHGNIQFHYSLSRRISMREAARFQSFPDDFLFYSKLRETERQIGNAVPPVLAWHIARSIQELLDPRA
ncbi:MAG: DNA cytosine methyltransferase [Planctomycetes bacterium]|nr:DNA cytosine methyltransferase [Planctomycetota bacterium]